jgi:hypothetical protein
MCLVEDSCLGCHGLGVLDVAVSLAEGTATPKTVRPFHPGQIQSNIPLSNNLSQKQPVCRVVRFVDPGVAQPIHEFLE